CLQHHSYPHSF
nr:immunoglobulin light chain junction region [Macaca mulatta]MOX56751.1 immunoglobulin light chain junction region [Macaca mulatta]